MSSLKVLIIGGGIGGPALAFWLAHLGHKVTVVERSPSLRAQGQQIDIRGQGVGVIRRMGIEPAIRSHGVDEAGLRFVDKNHKQQAVFMANKSGKGRQSFTSEFEIMRGDLVRILFDATKELGVEYVFGATIESFEQDDESVTVRLSNGSTGTYDLLVGADGQSSRTRRLMLGPGAKDPFYSFNVHTALFTVPKAEVDDNLATVCICTKKRVMFTRNDNPRTTQAYFILAPDEETHKLLADAERKRDVQEQKQLWIELFKDAGWQVPRFIKELEMGGVSDDFYSVEVGQVRLDKWYKNRVVLLGDAGYTPSPMTGRGTTSAFVGAYVLAGEISKRCSGSSGSDGIAAAVEAYDKAMRPFMENVQDIPYRPASLYPNSQWGVTVANTLLWLVSTLRIDKIGQWLRSDDVQGWKLPEYPGLVSHEAKGTKLV
ncbi:Uncharacterized protein C8034_v001496 [Colletotrichum sidae]|uniref:FAD-binding domain-containing protein n=1 Tax=Colletotrichum sidae TaxID=1347389 RepID=A0A4R8TDM7_9PEZI|nr:Uncharacterized protein C8034_v001496 [Colletotrichum sidae]